MPVSWGPMLFAGEVHDDLTVLGRGDETVVFFGGQAGHGLEPVREVGRALLDRPLLHDSGHCVSHVQFQVRAVLAGLAHCFVYILGETLPHDFVVEYHASIDFGDVHN